MSTIKLLIKPAIFTAGVCGVSFCGAAIVHHERHKYYPYNMTNFGWRKSSQHNLFAPPDWSFKQQQTSVINYLIEFRRKVNAWKNSLSIGHQIALGTIFVNLVVLGAWRVRAFTPVMSKYFISHSQISMIRPLTMLTSCFSHNTIPHFAFNMYALYSFSNISAMLMGPEQLIGFFLSAGVVSSFVSLAHRLAMGVAIPSLGASGALLGVVAYVCIRNPDSQLLLFFIPISAGNALVAIMAFDTIGLLARRSIMDHAAHLGGTLFGVWYAKYGEYFYHKHRLSIVETWRSIRDKSE